MSIRERVARLNRFLTEVLEPRRHLTGTPRALDPNDAVPVQFSATPTPELVRAKLIAVYRVVQAGTLPGESIVRHHRLPVRELVFGVETFQRLIPSRVRKSPNIPRNPIAEMAAYV